MRTREYQEDGALVSEIELELHFRRGQSEQSLRVASRFTETPQGKPLRAWLRQDLGTVPVEVSFEFTDSGIEAVERQGENERRQRMPLPEISWLTPRRSLEEIRRQLAANATEFHFFTIDPQMGLQLFEVQWALEARQVPLEIAGQQVMTSRWRQTQDYTPGLEYIVHLDASGHAVRTTMPLMGMEMTITRTSREVALAPHWAPEVLISSFIHPDRPIPRPRATRRVVYELRLDEGTMAEPPTVGVQTVERLRDHTRVVIDLDAPVSSGTTEDPPIGTYLRPSIYIDHEDPGVRRLHEESNQGADITPLERAESLRTFVNQYLGDKNLASVLATASEVAASGSGDCTEHSVLLAALLRAEGIPARVAAGLVYVENFVEARQIFGYHMWTQAHLDGHWVDLDATIEGSFDATHITFVTTGLEDQQAALLELARIAPLIGRLKIRVLEVHHEAPPTKDSGTRSETETETDTDTDTES
jgi:hypothetical protein